MHGHESVHARARECGFSESAMDADGLPLHYQGGGMHGSLHSAIYPGMRPCQNKDGREPGDHRGRPLTHEEAAQSMRDERPRPSGGEKPNPNRQYGLYLRFVDSAAGGSSYGGVQIEQCECQEKPLFRMRVGSTGEWTKWDTKSETRKSFKATYKRMTRTKCFDEQRYIEAWEEEADQPDTGGGGGKGGAGAIAGSSAGAALPQNLLDGRGPPKRQRLPDAGAEGGEGAHDAGQASGPVSHEDRPDTADESTSASRVQSVGDTGADEGMRMQLEQALYAKHTPSFNLAHHFFMVHRENLELKCGSNKTKMASHAIADMVRPNNMADKSTTREHIFNTITDLLAYTPPDDEEQIRTIQDVLRASFLDLVDKKCQQDDRLYAKARFEEFLERHQKDDKEVLLNEMDEWCKNCEFLVDAGWPGGSFCISVHIQPSWMESLVFFVLQNNKCVQHQLLDLKYRSVVRLRSNSSVQGLVCFYNIGACPAWIGAGFSRSGFAVAQQRALVDKMSAEYHSRPVVEDSDSCEEEDLPLALNAAADMSADASDEAEQDDKPAFPEREDEFVTHASSLRANEVAVNPVAGVEEPPEGAVVGGEEGRAAIRAAVEALELRRKLQDCHRELASCQWRSRVCSV